MTEFNYSGHGRTRKPKNVHPSNPSGQVETSTDAPTNDPAADNSGQGYSTENQRFLHLLLDTSPSGNDRTVTVHGYNFATNRWSPVFDIRGTAVSLQSDDTSRYQIFEIDGIDKVYFQITDDLNGDDFFFASVTTF